MQICLAITPTYRDVPKVFGHCNVLLYISYKTTNFENIIPKSILVRFWWNFYQQKRERTYFSVIILKYFLGAQILNVHDLNTNLNYLSTNVLALYCIFDVQNIVLCLNRELIKIIDYKFMLKWQCKTTFNSVFVGKKIIKIEQESTLE
jgi:hypothetical protein